MLQGIVVGGLYGALGGAAFGAMGTPDSLWKVGGYAAVGGGLSAASGGNFWDGVIFAGGLALAGYTYDWQTNGRVPKGALSDGDFIMKTDNPIDDMASMSANPNKNYMGEAVTVEKGNINGFGTESWGPFRWATSHIPILNDFPYFHDFGWAQYLSNYWNPVTNVGSMPPALALTVGAVGAHYMSTTYSAFLNTRARR